MICDFVFVGASCDVDQQELGGFEAQPLGMSRVVLTNFDSFWQSHDKTNPNLVYEIDWNAPIF